MVTCGYALVDPTVCWVESRQRAAKPPVQYSHYTEIHQYLSVYGDTGSCVDTTLISITSYKGNRYSYYSLTCPILHLCGTCHIWSRHISINLSLLAQKHQADRVAL